MVFINHDVRAETIAMKMTAVRAKKFQLLRKISSQSSNYSEHLGAAEHRGSICASYPAALGLNTSILKIKKKIIDVADVN